jgi:hypothetical protein
MGVKLIIVAVSLFLGANASAQSVRRGQDFPKFMGRQVTVIEPEADADGSPKGSASICIEGPPQRQCYTAPQAFKTGATVALFQLEKDMPALLFSAASIGVSGW